MTRKDWWDLVLDAVRRAHDGDHTQMDLVTRLLVDEEAARERLALVSQQLIAQWQLSLEANRDPNTAKPREPEAPSTSV